MKTIPFPQMRSNLKRFVRRVRAGATFILTRHGQPVALIEPVERKTRPGRRIGGASR